MNRFAFVDCTTVDQALAELKDGAVLKAGGIDLLDLMKEGIVSPPRLVNIRNVSSLRGITVGEDGLHLKPLVTLAEISEHPEIRRSYSALADAAGHAATPQVRNMATLGGNITQRPRCWYFRSSDFDCKKKGGTSQECHAHDGENQYHAVMNNSTCASVHPSSTAVPLLAMDARVEITSKRGKRTVNDERVLRCAGEKPDQRDRLCDRTRSSRRSSSPSQSRYPLRLSEVRRKRELRLASCRRWYRARHGWREVPKSSSSAWSRRAHSTPFA